MADNTYQGMTVTKKFLKVHWRQEIGTRVRFETLNVPLSDLAADETFMDHLGYAVAEHMHRVWGMTTEDNPLF